VIRRHLPLVLAALALVLAFALALLARDVRGWQESIDAGDRSFQVTPGPPGLWDPDDAPMKGLARRLLGIDDDLALREAGQLLRRSRPRATLQRTPTQIALGTSAQLALSAVQRDDVDAELRSAAANELGTLAFADVLSDSTQASERAKRGVQKFTEAVKLDPTNEAAMFNLELLLTLARAQDPRVDPEGATARGGGSASGAGSSSGGRGF
jgi:hypothetical protein